jgi:hypothetical protein
LAHYVFISSTLVLDDYWAAVFIYTESVNAPTVTGASGILRSKEMTKKASKLGSMSACNDLSKATDEPKTSLMPSCPLIRNSFKSLKAFAPPCEAWLFHKGFAVNVFPNGEFHRTAFSCPAAGGYRAAMAAPPRQRYFHSTRVTYM